MNKNDIVLIGALIFTALFVGSIMYAMWMADDPTLCQRKACLVFAWGIRVGIIVMPIGVSVFVIRIFNQSEEPNKQTEQPKEESFDYSKMGASNERPFRHEV